MNTWQFFSKIPFWTVVSVKNYIIEERFQFITIKIKTGPFYFDKKYEGNKEDFAEPFLTFLSNLGAKIETLKFDNRKSFELIAARTPVLKRVHFNWDRL